MYLSSSSKIDYTFYKSPFDKPIYTIFKPNDTDSYKFSHGKLSREINGSPIDFNFSYFEARTGGKFSESTFYGLQILLAGLEGPIITKQDIDRLEIRVNLHMGPGTFQREMWDIIINEHAGHLPIQINAIPEGTTVPIGNMLFSVINTDPRCAALVGYLETFLSRVWYPTTVCTISRNAKQLFINFLELTSDCGSDILPFMLHDFGSRGVSSQSSAAIGGSAHLVNFKGTDTFVAVDLIDQNYSESMAGFSVVATEHSVMTAGGRKGEFTIIERLIEENSDGILSLVLDSYDIENALQYIITELKEQVLARNGKLVIRPDSGDAVQVVLLIYNMLADGFGTTLNSKGFKVLNPKVGVIYGDGITPVTIDIIFQTLMENGFETSLVCGMGGGLLQKLDRDTQKCAYKCSAIQTQDGIWHDVFKDPKGGNKKSKAGRLKLILNEGEYKTVRIDDQKYIEYQDQMKLVFRNGVCYNVQTFQEIRDRSEIGLKQLTKTCIVAEDEKIIPDM